MSQLSRRTVGYRAWVITAASLLLLGLTLAACHKDEKHLNDKLEWTPFEKVAATFPLADKPIFLYISQNNCQWCAAMENKIFTRPEIAWYLNTYFRFVNINVDEDIPITLQGKQYDYRDFWQLFQLEGLPAYYCFDSTGQVNGIFHGTQDVLNFKRFLKYVHTGQFGRTPWLDWVKTPAAQMDTLYGIF
ncbi:MAG: DUF255 domain-containing protein [Candidatus Zixiibacteriota bacterium]|nr:MAG: DUF255 domain-containing protein [candidate division Zixibacteria bacterium]